MNDAASRFMLLGLAVSCAGSVWIAARVRTFFPARAPTVDVPLARAIPADNDERAPIAPPMDAGHGEQPRAAATPTDTTATPIADPWVSLDADGTTGTPRIPARPVNACKHMHDARESALSEFLARERARLAPKMSARDAKVLALRLRIARDLITSFAPGHHRLCGETSTGTWELAFSRFEGSIKADAITADATAPDPTTAGAESHYRFFDVEARGIAEVRYRGKDGAHASSPAWGTGEAFSIKTRDGGVSGAAVKSTFIGQGGAIGGEPSVLLYEEKGAVDLIDNNPDTRFVSKLHAAVGPEIVERANPIAPFPLRGMSDVDGDGRSDLLTPGPFVGALPNVHGTQQSVEGPELVAHARSDGSFAFDDDVARAHARALCPKHPHSLSLPAQPAYYVEVPLFVPRARHRIVCAKLWGVPAWKIEAALVPFNGALARWARVTAPVSLSE